MSLYNISMEKGHYVYILKTEKDTLYCGYSDDVDKRFSEHLSGKGAKYTKAFKPEEIVFISSFETKSQALKEEYRIKHKLTKYQKNELIHSPMNLLHH